MSGIVIKRPRAVRDLDEAADYIRRQSGPARAVGFLRAANSEFQRLADQPGLGTLYEPDDPAFADLRVSTVSRFKKYLIFYRPVRDGIEVLRVLHGARDLRGLDSILDDADEDEVNDAP